MEISLFNAVLLDVLVWMACVIALLAFAKLSVTHPATTYLAFHALLFSARAIAILNGAAALFSGPTTTSVTEAEISRALLLADFGLAAMTCGWILAAYAQTTLVREPRGLRLGIIRVVSTIAIPLGCVAILLWSKLPFLGQAEISGPWATSNWIVIAQTWAGLSLLVLIYWYGFKPVLTIPMALYLAFVIYQGAFRFRLLVPVILLIQIYLDRRGRRWPTLSSAIMLLACGLLFFPLKEIGQQLQSGDSIENVWQNASEEITNAFRGSHPDQTILDQFASTLTLADQHEGLFWGRTYSGLLTVIVPRQWWPAKPGLADFEKEISIRSRPMSDDGMVVTMLGEFYLNFSYVGVALLSFGIAYLSGRWFKAAYERDYFSLARFTYLLVACNLLQVFRDGLISLFVFVVINMLPLTAIAVAHLFCRTPELSTNRAPILQTPRVRSRAGEQSTA